MNARGLSVVGFTWPIFRFVVGNEKSADRGDCRATTLFGPAYGAASFVIEAKSGGEKTTARLLTPAFRIVELALPVPAWLLEIIRAGASTEDVETSSRIIAKRLIRIFLVPTLLKIAGTHFETIRNRVPNPGSADIAFGLHASNR